MLLVSRLIAFFFCLALANITMANPQAVVCSQGSGPAGGTCVTISESSTSTPAGIIQFGTTANYYYVGFEVAGSAHNMCQIDVLIGLNTGDISGNTYYVAVYSLTGNDLNVLQGTSAGVPGDNSWSKSAGEWVTFTFSSPVTVSTGYAVVVYSDTLDASNFARLFRSSSDDDSGYSAYRRWNQSGTWQVDQTYDISYRLYT